MLTRREMFVLASAGAAWATAVLSGRDARAAIAAQTPANFDVPRGGCLVRRVAYRTAPAYRRVAFRTRATVGHRKADMRTGRAQGRMGAMSRARIAT